jgi:hypothetical protein
VFAAKTAAGRNLAGFSLHPFPTSFRPFARRLRGKESSSSSLHPFPSIACGARLRWTRMPSPSRSSRHSPPKRKRSWGTSHQPQSFHKEPESLRRSPEIASGSAAKQAPFFVRPSFPPRTGKKLPASRLIYWYRFLWIIWRSGATLILAVPCPVARNAFKTTSYIRFSFNGDVRRTLLG